MAEAEKRESVRVRVSFPISKKGPYEADDPRTTTVGTVLGAAMKHFQVENDTQFTYVLTFDGVEQKTSTTIGELAGDKDEVRFNLVKKITQW